MLIDSVINNTCRIILTRTKIFKIMKTFFFFFFSQMSFLAGPKHDGLNKINELLLNNFKISGLLSKAGQ